MKIATKILGSFGVALLLVAVVGGVAWWSARAISHGLVDVADSKFPSVQALWKIMDGKADVSRGVATLNLRRADEEMRSTVRAEVEEALGQIAGGCSEYEKIPRSAEASSLWAAVKTSLERWRVSTEASLALSDERARLMGAGTSADLRAIASIDARMWAGFHGTRKDSDVLEGALTRLIHRVDVETEASVSAAHAASSRGLLAILGAILLGAGLLAAMGFALGRSIGATVRTLVSEAGTLRQAVAAGQLGVRGEVEKVDPEFRGIVQGMNETLDAYAKPVNLITAYLARISKGDVPPPITERYEGDFDVIKEGLNRCVAALSGLIAEMSRVAGAQAAGDVDAAVDEARFEGAFRSMAQGVNESTRLHVRTMLDGLAVLARYGEGDFKPVMRSLPGKQALMNQTFDRMRTNLMRVATEIQALTRAAIDGKLSVRADTAPFSGDWKALVEGVNATLDAVVGPLEVAARYVEQISNGAVPPKITERYAGDFGLIKDSLNRCIDAVNLLVSDANALAAAAAEGNLRARADANRHQNDFRKIVEGVNRTLEAVIAPVNEAAQVLEQLSRRDLRARMTGTYRGDLARMKDSVNVTADALHEALTQVATAVDQVSSAAEQIASSSQAVSSGASQQAASLEQTSASIESVAATVKHSSDSAQQANALSQSARAAAGEGAAAVEQMHAAMGRIKQSAEGTSLIIKDINEIAFQTNLLALNAAVEAARAGEAGRGFAVVAEEVRSLARRAKEAATKTEELIRGSVKQAEDGEVSARHVSTRLAEIVQGAEKVTAIVGEIAAASREQATAVDQVTRAVSEMDKVTQQNAASAEESSAAASELSGQAEELAALVGAFQLQRSAATSPRPATAPPLRAGVASPAKNGKNGNARLSSACAERVFPMSPDPALKDF